jgi:hypothetical protein
MAYRQTRERVRIKKGEDKSGMVSFGFTNLERDFAYIKFIFPKEVDVNCKITSYPNSDLGTKTLIPFGHCESR